MYMTHHQAVEQQGFYHQNNGVIFSDVSFGFMPAFKHNEDQQIHLSIDQYGDLSVMHLFDGLPDHWIAEKDKKGKAICLVPEVIAGFMRNGQFYTLQQIMQSIKDS